MSKFSAKRIVCDIDDTISVTLNRDWENAKPIQSVIDKLNKLHDSGWEIYLVTARGYLSCNGDRKLAEQKYREQIEKWLLEHNVKYTKLSFQKYLASYYVDDKSLRPDELVNLEIRKLSGGWSGADIELREGRVYKTAKDSIAACEWYKIASNFFDVPEIYSLIGETMCMEYLQPTKQWPKITDTLEIVNRFASIKAVTKSDFENSFLNYIERVKLHIQQAENSGIHTFSTWLNKISSSTINTCNRHRSFCHGDFTLDNMLVVGDKTYLIDPIYELGYKNTYSSWLLDVSKLLCSLRLKEMTFAYDYVRSKYTDFEKTLTILEASHFIRMYKYAPTCDDKSNIVKHYNKLMNEYI